MLKQHNTILHHHRNTAPGHIETIRRAGGCYTQEVLMNNLDHLTRWHGQAMLVRVFVPVLMKHSEA